MKAYWQRCQNWKVEQNNEKQNNKNYAQNSNKTIEKKNQLTKQNKIRCLSNLKVLEFLVQNNIKTGTELLVNALEQNKTGKKDLTNYLLSHTPKSKRGLYKHNLQNAESKSTVNHIPPPPPPPLPPPL